MTIRILAAARAEIEAAAEWYEAAAAGLGARFRNEVDSRLERLAARPGIAPPWLSDPRFRCLHLRDFPYTIFVRRRQDVWIVVAVTHQRRRPGSWRNR